MPRSRRVLRPALAAVVGLTLTTLGLTTPAHAAGGPTGNIVTLKSGVSLSGYDAATAADGTTYVGWIGDDADTPELRVLHLCVLKPGSKSCVGGVQTGDALGISSAHDLKVVITGGTVELVWIAQVAPDSGEFSGVFGTNIVTQGHLGSSVAVPGAPSLGELTSAIPHQGGVSVAAIGNSSFDTHAYYYSTLSATPKSFTRPYFVGNAQLGENKHQTVLTTSKFGSLGERVAVASKPTSGTQWSGFSTVKHSYTAGDLERVQSAGGHLWLVGMSDKDLFTPFVWKWKGSSFGNPKSTGDHAEISTVDATTDAAGRLVTVDQEVDGLAISNFGTGTHGAHYLVKVKDTFAGGPGQITTNASGRGWLIWGIERTGTPGQIFRAQPITLSAVNRTVHKNGRAGRVSLTGPKSCLPMTTTHVTVKGKAARGWHVGSKTLLLGSHAQGGTLNGAHLDAHHAYTLKGKVVFAKGSARSSVTATLSFKTCARP